jgi:hypothetical protein
MSKMTFQSRLRPCRTQPIKREKATVVESGAVHLALLTHGIAL